MWPMTRTIHVWNNSDASSQLKRENNTGRWNLKKILLSWFTVSAIWAWLPEAEINVIDWLIDWFTSLTECLCCNVIDNVRRGRGWKRQTLELWFQPDRPRQLCVSGWKPWYDAADTGFHSWQLPRSHTRGQHFDRSFFSKVWTENKITLKYV